MPEHAANLNGERGTSGERLGERRTSYRYPIELDLWYKVLKTGGDSRQGQGKTFDISSGGVSFAAGAKLPPDSEVELSIHWPYLLEHTCPLKLVVVGHVVRSEGERNAIRTDRYEFRLRGGRPGQGQPGGAHIFAA